MKSNGRILTGVGAEIRYSCNLNKAMADGKQTAGGRTHELVSGTAVCITCLTSMQVTNDELTKTAGMQDLSNIVKARRLTLAGCILRLPQDSPASMAM